MAIDTSSQSLIDKLKAIAVKSGDLSKKHPQIAPANAPVIVNGSPAPGGQGGGNA